MELKRAARRARAGEAGFSMIEALIAAAVLLILAIGMIPLFARSIINNSLGNDYTQATAHGLTGLEKTMAQDVLHVDFAFNSGTSFTRAQYLEKGLQGGSPPTDLDWKYTPTSAEKVIWTRTTMLRVFPIIALEDGQLTDDEVVPGGTSSTLWQVMEVSMLLDSGKINSTGNTGGLAAIRQTSFQFLKTSG